MTKEMNNPPAQRFSLYHSFKHVDCHQMPHHLKISDLQQLINVLLWHRQRLVHFQGHSGHIWVVMILEGLRGNKKTLE